MWQPRVLDITEDQFREEVKKEVEAWIDQCMAKIDAQHKRLLTIVAMTPTLASEMGYIERGLAIIARQTREQMTATAGISARLRGRFLCRPHLN